MKARKGICSRAWLFGIFVAIGLGVLGLPASRSAGITPTIEFVGVMTLANWLLVACYGLCFAMSARMLGSPREMLAGVNTFFYLSGWLVLLKIFEMPALGARFKAMAQSCTSISCEQAVTTAILHSPVARASDVMVLIGYAAFIGLAVVKMQRQVHDFGGGARLAVYCGRGGAAEWDGLVCPGTRNLSIDLQLRQSVLSVASSFNLRVTYF